MSKTENILKENGAFIRESLGVRKNGRSTARPIARNIDPGLTEDGELIYHQLVRNHHRVKLNPIEHAKALRKAMDLHNWSANHLSRVLGISNATISRTVALLKLPEPIQALVKAGSISGSAAYEITKIADREIQEEVANRVVSGRMGTARMVEMVKQVSAEETTPPTKTVVARTFVKVVQVANGSATIELVAGQTPDEYLEILEEILSKLRALQSGVA